MLSPRVSGQLRGGQIPPALWLWGLSTSPDLTESQNFSGWKGPLEITQSKLPAKTDCLQKVAQETVQTGSEYLQKRRLHNLSGKPVPVLCCPHSKEDFSQV